MLSINASLGGGNFEQELNHVPSDSQVCMFGSCISSLSTFWHWVVVESVFCFFNGQRPADAKWKLKSLVFEILNMFFLWKKCSTDESICVGNRSQFCQFQWSLLRSEGPFMHSLHQIFFFHLWVHVLEKHPGVVSCHCSHGILHPQSRPLKESESIHNKKVPTRLFLSPGKNWQTKMWTLVHKKK